MSKWIVSLLITISGCVPYSKADKIAFGVYCGTAAADLITTRQALQDGCYETNFFLNDYPSDMELISFKVGMTGVLWCIGEIFPDRREQVWYLASIAQGAASVWNGQQ